MTHPKNRDAGATGVLAGDLHAVLDGFGARVHEHDGAARVERELGIDSLYSDEHIGSTLVRVNLALHAKALLIRDVHYIVDDGKVALVDASRGRVAELQRWPDGLQAAVESKEGLDVSEGGRILDSITLQALMRRYPTVCGMTGTAVEATDQLRSFYGLHVAVIDRANELKRFDEADRIYATMEEKNAAIVDEIAHIHATGQPVLVGTTSIEVSELLSAELRKDNIPHEVLNAKQHTREAEIVAQAGATLAEQGYHVVQFCYQDSPRRAHSIAAQGGNLREQLLAIGAQMIRSALDPDLVAIERVVTGEAQRFPELATLLGDAGATRLPSLLADLLQQARGAGTDEEQACLDAEIFLTMVALPPLRRAVLNVDGHDDPRRISRTLHRQVDIYLHGIDATPRRSGSGT